MKDALLFLVFFSAGLIVLANSFLLLRFSPSSYDELLRKYPPIKFSLMLTFVSLIIIVPWQLGAIGRAEISALPREVWRQESLRHGIMNGLLAVVINLILLLWILILPGHFYAGLVREKSGKPPIYPYVMNVLTGLLLCTRANPIYRLLD